MHRGAGDTAGRQNHHDFDVVTADGREPRWGEIVYQEHFEDTHKSEAFDRYLEERNVSQYKRPDDPPLAVNQ